ncbi:hypothetical protein GJAV_G00007100 [Gymnothorax javanicus]|nr:hypothetical protein GJAV_G00007100 [Gymnothorax javanicus]
MTTDVEVSLSVSSDLSSVVEEAVRSAVCTVLGQIQRLIGRDVALLRAAVAEKECENEKLRVQLELARQELRERFGRKHGSDFNGDASRCNEHETEIRSSRHDVHRSTDEDHSSLALEQASSLWSQPWDGDAPSHLQQGFMDPLGSAESKSDLSSDVRYRIEEATDLDMEPTSTRKPCDMIPNPEEMKVDPCPSHERSKASGPDDAHTTRELTVIQVKEEIPARRSSVGPEPSHPAKPKPYICGECGKSYLWLKSLKKHQKIHSGEAPLSCGICCKHFSSQQLFEEHQRVHTSLRRHRCTSCPKTFSHLSNLKKHQLIHTGEKPHHCSLCGKCFRQIQHLKEHRKTHEDSKPFRCGECGWGFNHGSNFKRHLLVHTRQKMRHGLGS